MLKNLTIIPVCIILLVGFQTPCHAVHSSDDVDSLKLLIASQDDNTGKVDSIILLSQEYRAINQDDSALLLCDQALKLSRALDYR